MECLSNLERRPQYMPQVEKRGSWISTQQIRRPARLIFDEDGLGPEHGPSELLGG